MGAAAPATARLFSDAVAAFEAGHLDEARRLFEAVLERDGEHVAARYDLGVIAERQGDLPAAESAYRAAVDLDPSHPWALLNLCKVLREQGRAAEAVALLEAALQPGRANDVRLMNALAVAYRAAGQRDRAEAAARKVLARSGDDAEAYRVLALCALDQGNARLAELYALAARKRAEQDASVANTLGLVYLRMGDRPRALAELRRSLALDPSFAPAHLNLGSLALSSRDYATAERSFARALELQPWSRSASLLRAWALDGLRAQDPRRGVDAGAAFEKVLAFRPDDPEATCGAGFGYAADRAGYDRAVPFLEKCQQLAGTPQERQAAEAKLKTIQAVLSAAPEATPEERGDGSGGSGEVPPAGEEGEVAEEGSPEPAR